MDFVSRDTHFTLTLLLDDVVILGKDILKFVGLDHLILWARPGVLNFICSQAGEDQIHKD